MNDKEELPDQLSDIVSALKETLTCISGPVAIGLDMAAQEGEWGICVLVLKDNLESAKLCTLVPQAKINRNGNRSPTLLFRPSLNLLKTLLCCIHKTKRYGSLAVDTPFGWSCPQSEFLNGWSAQSGWQPAPKPPNAQMPSSRVFARRLCDLALNDAFPDIQPLAIGADKIALASLSWAHTRTQLNPYLGEVDLGLANDGQGFFTFETYPGAFVNLVAGEYADYKGRPEIRVELRNHLLDQYRIEFGANGEENLEWACYQRGSPNAFDAFLAALTAWDHVRWRADQNSVILSTPSLLLHGPIEPLVVKIRKEGWILVRTR